MNELLAHQAEVEALKARLEDLHAQEAVLRQGYAQQYRRFPDGYRAIYRDKEVEVVSATTMLQRGDVCIVYGLNWRGEPFDSILEDNLAELPPIAQQPPKP